MTKQNLTFRSFFLFALTTLLIQAAQGQSAADRQAAMRVVDGFFAALATSDTEALTELPYPGTLNNGEK